MKPRSELISLFEEIIRYGHCSFHTNSITPAVRRIKFEKG